MVQQVGNWQQLALCFPIDPTSNTSLVVNYYVQVHFRYDLEFNQINSSAKVPDNYTVRSGNKELL